MWASLWTSLATSLVGLVGEMVYLVDTGIQVWNSIEVNEMVNDPESGFGKEGGLVFENAGTDNGTSVTQRISNILPVSNTSDSRDEEGSTACDCTLDGTCLDDEDHCLGESSGDGGDTLNVSAPQHNSRATLPQLISDTDLQIDGGTTNTTNTTTTTTDCTVHTACLNGGTCWDNQCICSSGFSGIH